jgi:hypothetical protein
VKEFVVDVHLTGKICVAGVDTLEEAEALVMDAPASLAGKPLFGVQKYVEVVREIVTVKPDNVKLEMG